MMYVSVKSAVARRFPSGRVGRRTRIARAALTLAAGAVLIGSDRARAQTASWDPVPGLAGQGDGSVSGGSGTWDLLTPNWTTDVGLTDAAWVNGSAAVFGGTSGGVVTLINGGVAVGGITFDPTTSATTYTLQGQSPTDVLSLSAPQIATNQDATINATIGGSVGLTKLGAGTLTLGGTNTFSGPVTIAAGRLRVGSIANLGAASSLALAGGALDATGPLTFVGPVSVATNGGSIFLSTPASVVTLAGVVSGTGPLTIDGTGGGSLAVTNSSNFNGTGNTFTGNLSLVGGGSASLAYAITAPAGQVFSASAGTLTLGGSVAGATVSLAAGSTAQAFNTGILRLSGRATGPGIGVSVAGDLVASAGGRIEVGDGLDDSAQIRFLSSSHLTADNGTIVLRPRASALTLDSTTVNSLAIRNGGLLALGAGATGDLVLGTDVNQAGAWTLANQSNQTLRILGTSQDSTAGLTLRAEGGVTRYEVDTINLGQAAANGTIGVDLRGGTIDISSAAAGKTFTYSPGYVVSGWGQLGTSAANQAHVISAGGATFYANGPAASGATLNIVGGFNESAGTKASFRIANNNGLSLTVPNTPAAAYALGAGAVTIDPQTNGSIARLVVNGGAIQANGGAFVNPANKVRFDVVNGGTLTSDISGTGTLLVTGAGAAPINLAGGATFSTTSPTFTLKAGETIGGSGTLFTPTTNLTLNGTLALAGTLGAVVNGASTGTIRMTAGNTLTMTAAGDLLSTALSYGGTGVAVATLEMNAPSSTVRLGTGGAITNDAGFAGSREFRVTAGTFQADAADAATVTIDGANQLSIDRTANGVADRTLLGTLTLGGGAFQVGTTAATSTVLAGATLSGRGTFGHATAIDTAVNLGTVQAQGGQLNVNAALLKGSGTWDPNGQILALTGSMQDFTAGNPTQFRVAGSNGGRVQIAQAGNYTGGTVVDGSASANGVALRVSATNGTSTPLGSGPITLNSAALQLISDVGVNLSGNSVTVQGSGGTLIQYDRAGTATSSQTHRLGNLTVGGQTITLQGPTTTAYVHTLTLGGVTVTPAGATIVQQGANPVNFGNLTLNGNLALTLASTNFSVNALDGSGTLSRTIPSGTLNFKTAAAPTFTGKLVTAVGTTNFSASNVLAGGSYLITNSGATTGTVNVTTGGALNLASGTMAAGQFNLTVGGSLDGTNLNLTGGNVSANVANALGTGVLQLGGGNLFLRSNASAAFGGTLVAANGTAVTNLTVDHATGGTTTGGAHTVAALSLVDRQLNLIQANGFTLGVTGATSVSGTATSTLDNEISQLSLTSLQLNSGLLLLTGSGSTSIGQMGGAGGGFKLSTGGIVTITDAAQAGFGGTVQATLGTLNLNHPAALSGGSLLVNGGVVNLGAPLTGAPITLTSGFLNANVGDALAGGTVPVSNGSLFATTFNALGTATVSLTGGNITATAGGALGTAQVNLTNAVLALRSDSAAAFGGNVSVGGTNFSTISVARLTDAGGTGNRLSINSLTLSGGQTLNVTGADNDVFVVVNPVTISGTSSTTINTTAADAVFQGAINGAAPLTKSGVRTLTLDGGGNVGPITVSSGTLAVNDALTTPGVTVGGSTAATLEIGGTGANNIGALAVNNGTLRFARADASASLTAGLAVTGGTNGDVTFEYTGLSNGRVANAVTVDTSAAARKLTLAARSGTAAGQVGSFTYSGLIGRSGTNALTVVAQADSTQTDASGNLLRSPSRMILAGAQTFTSDLQHGGGIVIGKGNVPASGAGPFGAGTNPLQLTVMDSSVGGMVLDGQSSATFSKAVTTATSGGPRARLGAYFNSAGLASQTINFAGSFAWNDATLPLVVVPAPGVPGGAAGASLWNGVFADPGTILQVNAGAVLDNIITSTSTAVTSTAPVYAGGGGTVRFNSNFGDAGYRNLTTATGLAGAITVLDDTTVQSFTAGHHFDTVDLRTGTYQVGNVNQLLSGGFTVNASPFDATRAGGNLVTDFNLTLSGTGTGKAFAIAAGQTLTKSGAAALTVTGDQLHATGSTLAVTGGTVNLNTDAGTNATGAPSNKLSLTAGNAAATVNLNVTQHLAQVTVTGGQVKVAAGSANGSRVLDATGVSVTGGQLDLTNNRLIVDYTGATPITSIRQQLAAGYVGGAWTGAGIITSNAQADRTLALGFGEASEVLGAGGGTFGSETVDATSVLVRLTKAGDASLDGTVNFNDLLLLAQNYNKSGQTWNHGDFNYDGAVNFNDLLVLAQNYNSVAPTEPVPGASASFNADVAAAFAVAVPEPTTIGGLALVTAGALLRRRRRRA